MFSVMSCVISALTDPQPLLWHLLSWFITRLCSTSASYQPRGLLDLFCGNKELRGSFPLSPSYSSAGGALGDYSQPLGRERRTGVLPGASAKWFLGMWNQGSGPCRRRRGSARNHRRGLFPAPEKTHVGNKTDPVQEPHEPPPQAHTEL